MVALNQSVRRTGSMVADAQPQVIQLEASNTFRLGSGQAQVRVMAGHGWITLDGQDIVLEAGERAQLNVGSSPAIVSGVDGHLVVFEIS